MALDLDSLVFNVDTKQLQDAVDSLGKLADAMNNVAVAETKKVQAQAKSEQADKKQAKQAEEAGQKTDSLQKLLEKLNNTYLDMSKGFTRGEAGILNTARAMGAMEGSLAPVIDALQKIRGLSKDPFDSALGSVRSITAEFDALTLRAELASQQIFLTSKQLREYSKLKAEAEGRVAGTGLNVSSAEGQAEVNRILQQSQAEYLKAAKAVNEMTLAEKVRNDELKQAEKIQAEAANAAIVTAKAEAYLSRETEKLVFVNQKLSEGFTVASANALFKYREALEKTGRTADQVQQELKDLGQELMQRQGTSPFAKVQKGVEEIGESSKKMSAQMNHLARNIGMQFTDIWVSLANGQGLFTVLSQQGGQLADAFNQMGRTGVNASDALVQGFKNTFASWGVLYQGFKGLVAKGLSTVGEAATSSVSSIQRMIEIQKQYEAGVISATRHHRLLYLAQGQFLKSIGVMSVALGATLVGALAAVALAFVDVTKEINAMNRALYLQGAATGMSSEGLNQMAKSMQESGRSISSGREAITELIKAGVTSKDTMQIAMQAMIDLNKYGGKSMQDTAKVIADIGKEPVDALIKAANGTGYLTAEIVKQVQELVKQGDTQAAVELATKSYAQAQINAANDIKNSLDPVTQLWIEVKDKIKSAYEVFANSGTALVGLNAIKFVIQSIALFALTLEKGIKGTYVTLKASQDSLLAFDPVKRQNIRDEWWKQIQNIGNEYTAEGLKIINSDEQQLAANATLTAQEKANNEARVSMLAKVAAAHKALVKVKIDAKKMSMQEFIAAKFKEAQPTLGGLEGPEALALYRTLNEQYRQEYLDATEKKAKKEREVRDNTLSELTKTHNARVSMLKSVTEAERSVLQDSLDMGLIDRAEYVAKDLQLVKSQYDKLRAENDSYLADYETAFNKQYAKEKNADKRSNLVREFESVKEAVQAAGATLDAELGKKRQDILKQLGVETKKLGEDFKAFQKSLEDVAEARAYEIQMQQMMVGLSEEEQIRLKAGSDTYRSLVPEINKFAKALEEADKEYQALLGTGDLAAIWEAFRKRQDAEFYYIEAVKDRRVAAEKAGIDAVLKYELDERKKLADSLTDSIVTALIDGGKEGSKKIRQTIEAELREPVTLVVNAVVNAVLNDVLGAVGLGSGGGTLGAISQGMSLFSAGSSLLDVASQGFTNAIGKQFDKVINSPVGEALGLSKSTTGFTFNDQAEVIEQTTYEIEDFGNNLKEVGTALVATYLGGKIGNAISGGYHTGGNANKVFDTAATVASFIPGVNVFVPALTKIAQGVFNRFFGRKTISSGVQGFFQGSTGTFVGSQWEFQKGGTFRSDKTINSAVAEETQAMFDGLFGLAVESVKVFAKQLGLGTDALKDFKYFVQLDLFNKSPEEQQKLLEGAVSGLTEAVAKELLFAAAGGTGISDKQARIEELNTLMQNRGARKKTWLGWESERNKLQEEVDQTIAETLKDFVKYGETYTQALERMSTNLNTLNAIFDILGWKLYDVSLAGAGAAGTFADLFGGLDQAKSALSTYYDNFYSEQEKTDNLLRVTTEAFKLLGLQIPKTREGFRALVESARAAGDDLLVANLLALQGNIINLTPAVEGLATVFGVMLDTIDNLDIQMLQNRARMLSGTQSTELQGISTVLTAIPAHADGGAYKGGLALVGERGPEIIDFSSSGTVYNASKTARMLDESGSDTETKRSLENISHETRANSIHLAKLSKMLDSVIEQDYLKTKAVAA